MKIALVSCRTRVAKPASLTAKNKVGTGYPYDPELAMKELARADPALGRLMTRVGAFALPLRSRHSPFKELLRAIAFQQLSTKAAMSIYNRLLKRFPKPRYPRPELLLAMDDDELRDTGLSRAKVVWVRNLATGVLDGTVPQRRHLHRLSDEDIVKALTAVGGIGVWSVQMLLIFNLGRPDVLPAGDLGIRRGFKLCHEHGDMPTPKALLAHGERWRPYRSIASWYLWRANYL